MKPAFFLSVTAFMLAACGAAKPDHQSPTEAAVVPAATVKLISPPAPPGVPLVVKQFDAAKAQELTAAFKPDATAQHIGDIDRADTRARAALTALGLQKTHPTAAVQREADDAVKALTAVLSEP
jgi:hypothetical protein